MTGKLLPFRGRSAEPQDEDSGITVRDLSVVDDDRLFDIAAAVVLDGVELTPDVLTVESKKPFLLELATGTDDLGNETCIARPMTLRQASALRDALTSLIDSNVPRRTT